MARSIAIIPKHIGFNEKYMSDMIERELDKAQEGVFKDFQRTTSTWKDKPHFQKSPKYPGRRIVWTRHWVYFWLNYGTRPHKITAKHAKSLAFFRTGFMSKTVAGSMDARAGAKANQNFVRPMTVNHPGTKARNWDKMIRLKWQKNLTRSIRTAIKKAANHQ
jgi:hypothetical protein